VSSPPWSHGWLVAGCAATGCESMGYVSISNSLAPTGRLTRLSETHGQDCHSRMNERCDVGNSGWPRGTTLANQSPKALNENSIHMNETNKTVLFSRPFFSSIVYMLSTLLDAPVPGTEKLPFYQRWWPKRGFAVTIVPASFPLNQRSFSRPWTNSPSRVVVSHNEQQQHVEKPKHHQQPQIYSVHQSLP